LVGSGSIPLYLLRRSHPPLNTSCSLHHFAPQPRFGRDDSFRERHRPVFRSHRRHSNTSVLLSCDAQDLTDDPATRRTPGCEWRGDSVAKTVSGAGSRQLGEHEASSHRSRFARAGGRTWERLVFFTDGPSSTTPAHHDELLARPHGAPPCRVESPLDRVAGCLPWPELQHAPVGHVCEFPRRLFIWPDPPERHPAI
jgi:hypothetical protein